MGCTCGYNNDLNSKTFGIEDYERKIINNQNKNLLQDELMRITSMSRISSQRSIMLNSLKKAKEMREPMKIGKQTNNDNLQ